MKEIVDRIVKLAQDKCLTANELSVLEYKLKELVQKRELINRESLTCPEINDYVCSGQDDIIYRS